MQSLVFFAMHFIAILFLVGLAGSVLVVIMSFVEDLRELFRRD
jgi:hypothetical protein